ncbi:hypothetical protein FQN50_006795 [Emmonsiellopsis sp. PD_5]|nr:hypothetical protein FQN50_006795 [Emmonsiellopsis sp. PD_5]
MPDWRKSTLALSLLGLPLLSSAGAVCADVTLNVHAAAGIQNIALPPSLFNNSNALSDLLNFVVGTVGEIWPLIPIEGTYPISAIYCEPEDGVADTVQILAHGATYTKEYFSGHGLESAEDLKKYSWAHFAADEGYASLSIDRLGQGASSSADPLLEVQVNLHAEMMKAIADQLRAGDVVAETEGGKIGGKKFDNVVFVGHSLGSAIGNAAARRNPDTFDALILTGWSANLIENFPKVLFGNVLPALLANIVKWGHLHIGYLAFTIEEPMRRVFFGKDGSFDPEIQKRDWDRRSTVGLGEMLSLFQGTKVAAPYKGPVQVIIGEYDNLLCNKGPHCRPGPAYTPGNAADIFPSSSNYTYSITPNSGHNLNLHYAARDAYAAAHEFLRHNL